MRYSDLVERRDYNRGLAGKILDILAPIVSNGIDRISINQVISKLQNFSTGMKIDRAFIMKLMSPDRFPMVKKIEGDDIFLNQTEFSARAISKAQKNSEQKKITATATAQAKKDL